jgi:phosphoglycolate phosphatase-like HAD superfamily hydrolase
MTLAGAPDILALDFDGVLCDGMREYFETSRRTHARVWPDDPVPGEDLLPDFRRLRPVILSGWEMPLLLRAIAAGRWDADMLGSWEAVRDDIARSGSVVQGDGLVELLKRTLDQVRTDWIAASARSWLDLHAPYCPLDVLRRLVAQAAQPVLVTTKEGAFARRILEDWDVRIADIQGKEAGSHKCDNLRTLIAARAGAGSTRPRLWFIEDRLETLRHVTTHPDLEDVELFLAAWGYNTPDARASARADARIRLLDLDRFQRGLAHWL